MTSWLTAPFTAVASTLKSLTSTNLRDVPITTSTNHHLATRSVDSHSSTMTNGDGHSNGTNHTNTSQRYPKFQRMVARAPPGTIKQAMGDGESTAFNTHEYVNQSRDANSRLNSRRPSTSMASATGTPSTPIVPTENITSDLPSATAASSSDGSTTSSSESGIIYPVQTPEQLHTYTTALMAAVLSPNSLLARSQLPPPPSESMTSSGGMMDREPDDLRVRLNGDDAMGMEDEFIQTTTVITLKPIAPPPRYHSTLSPPPPEPMTPELRLKLQQQLQLSSNIPPSTNIINLPSLQRPPSSSTAATTTTAPAPVAPTPMSSTTTNILSPCAVAPLAPALPFASTAASFSAPTTVVPSPHHAPILPPIPFPTHGMNGHHHARATSKPDVAQLAASSTDSLTTVTTALQQPPQSNGHHDLQPPSTITIKPDLSSFSSANYDDHITDEDEDEKDLHDMVGAQLLPDLGIKLPFGFGQSSFHSISSQLLPPPTHLSSAATQPPGGAPTSSDAVDPAPRNVKLLNFHRLLSDDQADLGVLRKMSWQGIPTPCRAMSWKLLLGYVPVLAARRAGIITKRRQEYEQYLKDFYYMGDPSTYDESLVHRTENELEILKQIRQDVPRTSPAIKFFKDPAVQKSLERILYIFAVRHPASGYVQGINDLATPFYQVFTAELYGFDLMTLDTSPLQPEEYLPLEADCFWCMSYLIDGIQDHYTFAQPGIQRMVYQLKELILRIDGDTNSTAAVTSSKPATTKPGPTSTPASTTTTTPYIGLHAHFERENVQFLHFAFRWMTCLLMRELKLPLILRLWDSYLSEEPSFSSGFKVLHVYVCAAFLMTWSKELKAMDFQQLIQFLQKLPTDAWTNQHVETLLAQAHVYKTLFHSSPHLR